MSCSLIAVDFYICFDQINDDGDDDDIVDMISYNRYKLQFHTSRQRVNRTAAVSVLTRHVRSRAAVAAQHSGRRHGAYIRVLRLALSLRILSPDFLEKYTFRCCIVLDEMRSTDWGLFCFSFYVNRCVFRAKTCAINDFRISAPSDFLTSKLTSLSATPHAGKLSLKL